MPLTATARARLQDLLAPLYPGRLDEVLAGIEELAARYTDLPSRDAGKLWNERDAVLITYGDQVRSEATVPLESQREFLIDAGLDRALSTVHFLPF